MKIYKKMISLLLIGGVFLNTSGCSKDEYLSISLTDAVDLNKDNTYLDDIDKEITLEDGRELNIIDASDLLEKNIRIKELLDTIDFSSYSNLKKDDKLDFYSVTLEEVESYVKKLDNDNAPFLFSLQKHVDEWLSDNTYNITEELLLTTIKTSVAPLVYSDSTDYDKIIISSNYDLMKGNIEYYDEKLKSDVSLYVDIDNYVYKDMTSLYSLQEYDEDDSLNYDNILEVLNQNKYLLGEDLEIDGEYIVSNDSEKVIVKHLQK